MLHCQNCINWVDESLAQIESEQGDHTHIFMGCRIHGCIEDARKACDCAQYKESANLFAICATCRIAVPKVCVSLGECVNCTDTDLFCVDSCFGEESRKYCTHFVRLHSQGVQLIEDNQVFEIFPKLDLPGEKK